jgi:hypothetical protein
VWPMLTRKFSRTLSTMFPLLVGEWPWYSSLASLSYCLSSRHAYWQSLLYYIIFLYFTIVYLQVILRFQWKAPAYRYLMCASIKLRAGKNWKKKLPNAVQTSSGCWRPTWNRGRPLDLKSTSAHFRRFGVNLIARPTSRLPTWDPGRWQNGGVCSNVRTLCRTGFCHNILASLFSKLARCTS